MKVCDNCRRVYDPNKYGCPDCEVRFTSLSIEEMAERIYNCKKAELDLMLDNGECVQAYYNQELDKITEEYNEQVEENIESSK